MARLGREAKEIEFRALVEQLSVVEDAKENAESRNETLQHQVSSNHMRIRFLLSINASGFYLNMCHHLL